MLGLAYLAFKGGAQPSLAPAAKEGALAGLMAEQQQPLPPPPQQQQQARGLPDGNGYNGNGLQSLAAGQDQQQALDATHLGMLPARRQNLQSASPFPPAALPPSLPGVESALLFEAVYQKTPSPPTVLADLPTPPPMQVR